MTVYLVISLPRIPYIYTVYLYMVLAIGQCVCVCVRVGEVGGGCLSACACVCWPTLHIVFTKQPGEHECVQVQFVKRARAREPHSTDLGKKYSRTVLGSLNSSSSLRPAAPALCRTKCAGIIM